MKPTIEERHAERDRRDAEQVEREQEALSKLYRMEFYMVPCDSCGGHRQSRYVPVEPCEHGKYDAHGVSWIRDNYDEPSERVILWQCPGAGLEDLE